MYHHWDVHWIRSFIALSLTTCTHSHDCFKSVKRQPKINLPFMQSTPQIPPPSAICTEAVTFNSGIHRATERDREGNRPRPIILGIKLGSFPRGPAFLLVLALVIVVAMSASPASATAADRSDLGEAPSRPPRPESRMLLVSRPRQPRLTKEWRQQRGQQVKHRETENGGINLPE